MVNMMSSGLLPSWQPTLGREQITIANMATDSPGKPRKAKLYIDEWFEHRGVNDTYVASVIGRDRTTVWKWRNKPSRLDPGKMELLAGALGIEPNQLYGPPSAPPPPPPAESLDEIVKDYPDDLKKKAAAMVRLLGRTD